MLNKELLSFFVVSSLTLTACSGMSGSKVRWNNFSQQSVMENVSESDAGLLFYRESNDKSGDAISIAINGEYQTSLQEGGYSQAIVCSQPQRIGAFLANTDLSYERKRNSGQYFKLAAGKVTYLKASVDASGKVTLTEVEPAVAKQSIQPGKYQANTLPRVDRSKTCDAPKYVLDASALFALNKFKPSDIINRGHQEIVAVAQNIKTFPQEIKGIEVLGYTDPQGNANYNLVLSKQRAQTVKDLLVKAGINANLIQVKGVGAGDLIVKDCASQYGADKAAVALCNQPNRRVEIKLHFVK